MLEDKKCFNVGLPFSHEHHYVISTASEALFVSQCKIELTLFSCVFVSRSYGIWLMSIWLQL